jgi:hypothetical protein
MDAFMPSRSATSVWASPEQIIFADSDGSTPAGCGTRGAVVLVAAVL